MGVLTAIAGSAVSAGLSSLLGNHAATQEFRHQKKLMAIQQGYARENAATANQYARENAMDAPLLQKLGKQQAGYNTAFGQNGNVSSVSSPAPAPTPSAPGPLGIGSSVAALSNSISKGITSVTEALLQQEQAKKAASERKQIDIDNITRAAENIARINKFGSSAAKDFADAALTNLQKKFKEDTYESDKSIKASEATIADANAQTQHDMNIATIDEKIASASKDIASGQLSYQEIENKKEEIKNLKKERDVMDSTIADNYSHVGVNDSQKRLNLAKAFEAFQNGHLSGSKYLFQEIQNNIASATKEDVIKLAHREVAERGPQSVNQWTWDRLNRWDELTGPQKVGTFFGLLGSAVGELYNGAAVGAIQGGAMGYGFNKGQKIATPKRNPIGFR